MVSYARASGLARRSWCDDSSCHHNDSGPLFFRCEFDEMERWVALRGLEAGQWRRKAEDADAARNAPGGDGGRSTTQESEGAKPEVSGPAWRSNYTFRWFVVRG